jgi:hypothetical protein
VIGAMKAGTTSLYSYMAAHPQIAMPGVKELDYFVAELNWPRGLAWYQAQFASTPQGMLTGDVSPNYTKHPLFGGVPERMVKVLPAAKLIYVLRDPVARMRSHWMHAVDARTFGSTLERALLEDPYFRQCSTYGMQLERYLEHYSSERILLITAEDLQQRRDHALHCVWSFLEIDATWRPAADIALHESEAKRAPRRWIPERIGRALETRAGGRGVVQRLTRRRFRDAETRVSPETHARVRELLRPDMERLAEHMPPDFDAWGILG